MKKRLLIFMNLFLMMSFIFGQTAPKICGSMEYLEYLQQKDPMLESNMQKMEDKLSEWIENNQNYSKSNDDTITIPVVVHIVLFDDLNEVSDAEVIWQIDKTNEDFGGSNPNSMAFFPASLKSDTRIQFCLASRKSDGSPTIGIERLTLSTPLTFYYDEVKHDSFGGLDAWDPLEYFNIWVCDYNDLYLGMAKFPTTGIDTNFGVIIDFTAFGNIGTNPNYSMGATTTHEIGHCLNLHHIWADDDTWSNQCLGTDLMEDTPNQELPVFGSPSGLLTDGCTSVSPGIMYMNFMDYTEDQVKANFTPNQKDRMRAVLLFDYLLLALSQSYGCQPPDVCNIPQILHLDNLYSDGADLSWSAISGALSYNFLIRESGSSAWTTYSAPSNSYSVSGLTDFTMYEWCIQTVCSGGPSISSYIDEFKTLKSCGGIQFIWTGNNSGDWFNINNWQNNTVPTSIDDAFIPEIDTTIFFYPVLANGFNEICNLLMEDSSLLIIGSNGALTISGTSFINGKIIVTSDISGASGSIIDNGFYGDGFFEFKRYLSLSGAGTQFGYHFISTPLNNTVTGDFIGYWLQEWDEPSNQYYHVDPYINPCNHPLHETSHCHILLIPGEGYSVKQDISYCCSIPPTGYTIEFGGDHLGTITEINHCIDSPTYPGYISSVNTDTIEYKITGTNNNWSNGYPNWNLVGNPYPSGWDYDAFYFGQNWPAGLNDAIYYWDEDMLQYASYVFGIGNNGGDNFVPPTQAFFLEADGTVPKINLIFTNNERTHSGISNYYKNGSEKILKLRITANVSKDETVIRFLKETKTEWDGHFDAKKLVSFAEHVPSIYTKAGEIKLSINSLPETNEVPIFIELSSSGICSIEAIENDFEKVLLVDKKEGVLHKLNSSYEFYYNAGCDENRFVIHFGDISTENENGGFVIYSSQGNIVVYNINNEQGDVYVYNLMGQMFSNASLQEGINNLTIDNAQGYYIVNVRTSEGVVNRKVYIH